MKNNQRTFRIKDFTAGDQIQIFSAPYGRATFEVASTDGIFLKLIDVSEAPRFAEPVYLTDVNLEYYSRFIKVVFKAEPLFSEADDLSAVRTQLVGQALLNGEESFARTVNAIEKASTEFQQNDTIDFTNGVLTFISRFSKKQRKVTKFGCHISCDCKAETSYHKSLYDICATVFPVNTCIVRTCNKSAVKNNLCAGCFDNWAADMVEMSMEEAA